MNLTQSDVRDGDDYCILLMGFGQSNADVHDAGPRIYPSAAGRPVDHLPVMMPNDGKGFRGYMGGAVREPITGFVPISAASDRMQSTLAAAGARLLLDRNDPALRRVIVRSEARGGRRFFGIRNGEAIVDGIFENIDGSKSIIFTNLIATIRECLAAAQADGCPIRLVNMVWLHGESDRAMAREDYAATFCDLIDEVESRFADADVSFHWSVVQAGGTGTAGGGNFWPNRLAVMDVADRRANVSVDVAGYAYELMDGSHFSGRGKLLLGENIGRMITRRITGHGYGVPRAEIARLTGQKVHLTIRAPDRLVLDEQGIRVMDHTVKGFHTRDRTGAVLQDVEVVDDIRLQLSFDRVPDPKSLMIYYAFAHNRRGQVIQDGSYPVGAGCLRTNLAAPSKLLEGADLHDWVAGFEIAPTV